MAIGSTITYSVPAVGTTVGTLAKAAPGEYYLAQETGDVDVPIQVKLRRAQPSSTKRRLGATWRFRPNVLDVGSAISKGSIAVAINVDAELGSTMTRAEVLNHIRYAMSVLLKTDCLETLIDGSVE